MKTESPEAPFLHILFQHLNSAKITYAVLRNYKPLPQSSGRSDIDIIINPIDTKQAKKAIDKAILMANGSAIINTNTTDFLKFHILGKNNIHPGGWWGQCIDLFIGSTFSGYILLDNNYWQYFIVKHNSINVLADDFAGVLGVLKEVLHNSTLPRRYILSARNATDYNWIEIKKALRPMGKQALQILYDLIQKNENDLDVPQTCSLLRTALAKHNLRKHPYTTTKRYFRTVCSKVKCFSFPSGIVIAVLGVDGAGKSTVINAIKPALDMATHKATFVQHLRPGLLPPLSRLKGGKTKPAAPVRTPHGSKSSGYLGSLFRISYLSLDYIFGYWLKTRIKIAKQPTIVIFDRYAYDILLDPKRFRINLPKYLINFFLYFIPKPHLVFCLHGNAVTITDRKQELSLAETTRQINELQEFAKKQSNTVLISTNNDIQTTRNQVLNSLFDFLISRFPNSTSEKQTNAG